MGRNSRVCYLMELLRKFPTAIIHGDTPYYRGKLKVLCMDNPVYDLMIGNVPGSREPHEPNSNWTSTMNTVPEGNECSDVSMWKQNRLVHIVLF